jgi:hypothetical protein
MQVDTSKTMAAAVELGDGCGALPTLKTWCLRAVICRTKLLGCRPFLTIGHEIYVQVAGAAAHLALAAALLVGPLVPLPPPALAVTANQLLFLEARGPLRNLASELGCELLQNSTVQPLILTVD